MSLHAAGLYIRTLREARQLSREEIAAAAGTSGSQVERIENGKQETRSSVLFGLVRAVRGNLEHLQQLLLDEGADGSAGVTLANRWLFEEQRQSHRVPSDEHIAAFGKTKLFGRMLPTSAGELAHLTHLIEPYKPAAHIYEGWRDGRNDTRVLVDGEPLREVLGTPQAQYEWGYDGSGPFTLAQSILWHEYGRDVPHRYRLRFATDVVTRLPRQTGDLEWVLDSGEIALWFTLVRLLEKEQGIAFAKD